ncbi:MAG: sigma-54-dependent transcriptional regulator [Candidatus Tectimicrobiota bacterium]
MTPSAVPQLPMLFVDDEPAWLRRASLLLRAAGLPPLIPLGDSQQLLARLAEEKISLVLLDLSVAHPSGQSLLEQLTTHFPDIPVIVTTATPALATAVQCMKAGAIDYLIKPVHNNRLVLSVRHALTLRARRQETPARPEPQPRATPPQHQAFADIVTQNATMQSLFRYVEAIAPSPQPVLITGETGTGKELMARAVHRLAAPRGDFVAVNVAGLDDQVFSDTLFGHTRGAFTGADRSREGLITRAENGTLFLDEIGDLAAVSQVKLLRLLQEGTYYPLGADRPRQSRARLVVATNRDLVHDVQKGLFRQDLYYRLRTHHIHLPPLRARREDLALLVDHCLAKAAAALQKPVPTPPSALYQLLNAYAFPGNVRELEAMMFDAVARHQSGTLSMQAFKEAIDSAHPLLAGVSCTVPALLPQQPWEAESLPTLKEAEEALVAAALRHADGNQGVAAGLLGLSRQALNKRLRRRQPLASVPHACTATRAPQDTRCTVP